MDTNLHEVQYGENDRWIQFETYMWSNQVFPFQHQACVCISLSRKYELILVFFTEAEKESEVSKIRYQQKIMEKESLSQMSLIEGRTMHLTSLPLVNENKH